MYVVARGAKARFADWPRCTCCARRCGADWIGGGGPKAFCRTGRYASVASSPPQLNFRDRPVAPHQHCWTSLQWLPKAKLRWNTSPQTSEHSRGCCRGRGGWWCVRTSGGRLLYEPLVGASNCRCFIELLLSCVLPRGRGGTGASGLRLHGVPGQHLSTLVKRAKTGNHGFQLNSR